MDILSTEPNNNEQISNSVDLIRSLDIIFWNLAAFYVIFISTFQDIESSLFPYLSALPLFCIAYSTMKVPVNYYKEKWPDIVLKFRVFSIISAFTFPFFVFIQYLLIHTAVRY